MPPVKSLGNSRAQYNYKFGLTGLEAADPYVSPEGPVYSDDVFSTYLYEGTGSSETITNGIDLNGKGGLVWIKARTSSINGVTNYHYLQDSERSNFDAYIASNNSNPQGAHNRIDVSNDGFSTVVSNLHEPGIDYASWTFRKQPGFFDICTWSGDSSSGRQIPHSLGSTPGMIIIKNLTNTNGADWAVWHRNGGQYEGKLNSTGEFQWEYVTSASSTDFTLTYGGNETNLTGNDYVAYVFAHDDQRFGTNRDESIIKCGSFTTGTNGITEVDLGWEPQWLLVKTTSESGAWYITDNMRGLVEFNTTGTKRLIANSDSVEGDVSSWGPTSTGFKTSYGGTNGINLVYVAIRRPHKPIIDPTKLFDLVLQNSANPNLLDISLSVADMVFYKQLNSTDSNSIQFADRMRGVKRLWPYTNLAETDDNNYAWDYNNKVQTSFYSPGNSQINHVFRRAPGFFDVVAYSGSNSSQTLNHNLGVKPALMICKRRNSTGNWQVYADIPNMGATKYMMLDDSAGAVANTNRWNDTEPTATQFTLGTYSDLNTSGGEYISYLFGNLSGVCKIGEYTSGSDAIDVDCGFNPRFVMIKRVDAGAGNWFVWHSINAGNDSYILLDDNVVGVSNTDWIDPISNGFQVAAVSTGISNHLNLTTAKPFLFMAIA